MIPKESSNSHYETDFGVSSDFATGNSKNDFYSGNCPKEKGGALRPLSLLGNSCSNVELGSLFFWSKKLSTSHF